VRLLVITLLVLVAQLLGCDGGGDAILLVDLKTDLAAGLEFQRVRTELRTTVDGAALSIDHDTTDADYLDGQRVAEFDELEEGSVQLIVELLKTNGNLVARRPAVVQLTGGTQAVTIVATRSCLSVECPMTGDGAEQTACLDGRCVNPECTPESMESCGTASCTSAAECGDAPACVEVRCEASACLVTPRDGRCGAGEICDLGLGCIGGSTPPDAGPTDSGPPDTGAMDSGTPMDAGMDSGTPMDAGTDTAPPDVGVDAGPPTELACADEFLGSVIGSPVATGSTRGAGNDSSRCLGVGAEDVSFGWVAPTAGRYTFSTCGTRFDTVLTVLDGTCSGPQLGCNDDRCGWASSITLDVADGQGLVIIVDGLFESGSYELNISGP